MPTKHCTLLFFILYLHSSWILADSLNIAVASNFVSTLKKIKIEFEKKFPHQLKIISASSGKLFAQIQYGAPYDIFMSADAARPAKLQQLGLISTGSRQTYAIGQLALWSPQNNKPFELLNSLRFKRLAIANPKTAPYGKAAIETLQALHLFKQIKTTVIRGENINQTYQFVDSGNADIAFVSLSQVIHRKQHYQAVPQQYYSAIEQQLIIVKNSAKQQLSKQFVEFLKQDKIKNLIRNSGYKTP